MRIRRGWLSVAAVALLVLAAGIASAASKGSARVTPALMALHEEHATHTTRSTGLPFASRDALVRLVDERVVIDAVADGDVVALESALVALGARNTSVFGRFVSGELPISAIPALDGIVGLRFAQPSAAKRNVGSVTSQGDPAQRSDIARTTFGVTGAGVKVGVLSDSYNCLMGAPAGVVSNDLPAGVQVLQEIGDCTDAIDEGRAMAEIVHDVAPGAAIAFASAFNGIASFANNILALQGAGAKVIVDDIIYFAEPMFQDGIIAQAVDTVVASGAAYFSSAGNDARNGYESTFRPGSMFLDGFFSSAGGAPHFFGGVAHNFAPAGVDHFQRITILAGRTITMTLQWDSPFFSVSGAPGSPNDLDIYLLDTALTQVLAGAAFDNVGGDAVEIFSFTNSGATADFNLMIVNFSGANPGFIKHVTFGGGITIQEFNTASGTMYGHANAAGAEAVGAAFWLNTPAFGVNPPLLEPFSSAGPTPIFFTTAGVRLATPIVRAKPEIVAPDGGNTTFFFPGSDIPQDPDGFPNFFGTSAAAPHAAGVAALMLERRMSLAPTSIYSILEGTTINMGPAGFDFDTGFGLIQADSALRCIVATPLRQSRDFDGNCQHDILWRHTSGSLFLWFLAGASVTGTGSLGSLTTDWVVQGAGDFNGDGTADILWRHTSGTVFLQLVSGTSIIGAGSLGSVGSDWTIRGIGDFNGDGKVDILWRHTSGTVFIWFLNGTSLLGTGSVGSVSTDWTIQAVGDLNGDGKADIVWRHTSGAVFVWLLSGASIVGSGSLGSVATDWTIQRVADLNGDGRADILWRHTSGAVFVWFLNGTGLIGSGSLGSVDASWTIQGAFDFNADGRADVLWRHSSGTVFVWLVNGTSIIGTGSLGSVDASWAIQ